MPSAEKYSHTTEEIYALPEGKRAELIDGQIYDMAPPGRIHQELVQQIAEDKGFTVHLFECGEGDHVHCFVSAPPKLSITAIVKYLKGITGRKLFERFPEIRNQLWKGELWNHSYYVETIGSVFEENIRRYIEHQSKSY